MHACYTFLGQSLESGCGTIFPSTCKLCLKLSMHCSPMREIAIGEFPSPTIVERSCVQRDGEVPARTHRRSWSTDEASDNSGTMKPPLQRLK